MTQKFSEIWGSGHSKEIHGRYSPKYGMLKYDDHLQKWFDFGQYWLNYGPLVGNKHSVIGLSGQSEENTWKEWPEIWNASASWPHSEMIRFWPLVAKQLNHIGVSGIPRKTHGRNCPKSVMQVYYGHLQNWWDFGHGPTISYFWCIF